MLHSTSSTTGSPTSPGYGLSTDEPSSTPRGGAWLAAEEKESEVSRITKGYINLEGSDSTEYVEVKEVSELDCPSIGYIEG